MSKKKLFEEDSDEDIALKTENEYAKKYDAWREKEEMHKLEQKYGEKALNSDASGSSDSEDESDEPPEVTEEMEKQFLKTLALLKTKDPRIYDSNYKFFEDQIEKQPEKESKPKTLTFDDSDEDNDDGNIFSIEKKAEIVESEKDEKKDKKDGKLKEFLTGQAEHIDEEVEKDLEPLKALWSDPKLSEGEAFLRDYILNKKYLEEDETGAATDKLRDDEDLEADEKIVEEQGKFERAYNFRFEEPDEEYLKRFPRTMNYIRPKDDRRARKRAEVRERKEQEKMKKMEEIARLKALKLKEIQEKIAKIKEVTGNEELAFKEKDIEGDFDPEEHDRRMRAIFDEEYYGEADTEKPVFPDLDEELEIENWEKYEAEHGDEPSGDADGPHCEDEDFNMDADYDPKQARTNLMEEIQKTLGKKRRNRKKKSKLGQILSTEKPKFVPTVADKTYNEYMEEYYKMDCEDVIGGDLPTRFKYREVVPNDYGLTIEEILLADDKELTQWVPLKKIVRHRPENVEKGDVKTYAQKAQDARLKRKVLPSLFKELPEKPEIVVPIEEATKKKKKKKKNKDASQDVDQNDATEPSEETVPVEENSNSSKKKKKHKQSINSEDVNETETSNTPDVNGVEDTEHDSLVDKPKKKKQKQFENATDTETDNTENAVKSSSIDSQSSQTKKKKRKTSENTTDNVSNEAKVNGLQDMQDGNLHENSSESNKRKKKKKRKDGFVVESVNNVEPSQGSASSVNKNITDNSQKGNLKRKLDSKNEVPNKKKKKNKNKNKQFTNDKGNKKDFNKFKNDKFKNKHNTEDGPINPLTKLSDERLKAYGLNPKKYRGFLKYKKF